MTTYGLEIEMGDINLLKAAEIVFTRQGIPFEQWKDRGISLKDKVRKYDIWNISSDKTIRNHNGTKCRRIVQLPDGSIVGGKESNRQYWQGAELISPVLKSENIDQDFEVLECYLTDLEFMGANIDPDLFHDLHVHVDFGEQSPEQWKRLMTFTAWIKDAQYPLIKVHEAATENFSPSVYRYSNDFVEDLLKTQDYEEYSYEYRRHHKLEDGTRQSFQLYQYRRLACPGAVMDPTKSYNTLEWRMWPGVRSTNLIRRMAEFSISSTESFPSLEYVKDWSEETIEMIKEENANRKA